MGLSDSPLVRRMAGGAAWSLAGAVASRLLALAAAIVVARALGKARFGELAVIQSSVNMFSVLAGFGLGLTSTKFVAELRATDPERAGRIIALSSASSLATGAAASAALFLFAPWLAARALNAPHLAWPLRLSSPILLLGAWAGTQTGALAGFEAFKRLARVTAAGGFLNFPFLVAGVLAGGVPGAVCGLAGANFAACLVNSRALRAELRSAGIRPRWSGLAREWPVLWRFSVPAALGALMIGPVHWACGAMLVNRPDGYAEMGVLNAASQWRLAMVFVPTAVEAILLPVLASLKGAGDAAAYRRAILSNLALNAGLSAAAALAVALAAPFIMRGYGPGFEGGAPVLAVTALSVVLSAPCTVLAQALASAGDMWPGFFVNVLWGAAYLAATSALVRQGAMGVAAAMCAAYAVQLAAMSAFAWRRVWTAA